MHISKIIIPRRPWVGKHRFYEPRRRPCVSGLGGGRRTASWAACLRISGSHSKLTLILTKSGSDGTVARTALSHGLHCRTVPAGAWAQLRVDARAQLRRGTRAHSSKSTPTRTETETETEQRRSSRDGDRQRQRSNQSRAPSSDDAVALGAEPWLVPSSVKPIASSNWHTHSIMCSLGTQKRAQGQCTRNHTCTRTRTRTHAHAHAHIPRPRPVVTMLLHWGPNQAAWSQVWSQLPQAIGTRTQSCARQVAGPAALHACMPACLHARMHTCSHACMPACLRSRLALCLAADRCAPRAGSPWSQWGRARLARWPEQRAAARMCWVFSGSVKLRLVRGIVQHQMT